MVTTNVKFLNEHSFHERVKYLNDEYWNKSWKHRWEYMHPVIQELTKINPQSILELGAYKINLSNISDNMDLKYDYIDSTNTNNKIYLQNAIQLPWNITDKYYDVFIALQVFEHLEDKQALVFDEIQRISKNVILSFPYKWKSTKSLSHYMIDEKIIKNWTNNKKPYNTIIIGKSDGDSNRRIIYMYKF